MSAVPFVLVTGFLGSGKTTLLKRILETHAGPRRIAVVQNEFAASGVDGVELRRTGKPFEVLEINRGSVFCVCLLSDFVKSLAAMVERVRPDGVVLEATGLADPIAVAELLHAPELQGRVFLARVYCVADAVNFTRLEASVTRVAHQVRVADTVLVNKVDTAVPEAVVAVEQRVRTLNPFAQIVRTSYCGLGVEDLFAVPGGAPVAERRAAELAGLEPGGRPGIGSAAVRSTRPVSREALDAFLAAQAPAVYRLKGFVRLAGGGAVAVQSCFGATEVRPADDYQGPSELVAMGPGLDGRAFARAFRALVG